MIQPFALLLQVLILTLQLRNFTMQYVNFVHFVTQNLAFLCDINQTSIG